MYSIRELELISGVKAHTIRIWEKRYQLLIPQRSSTGIRSYDDKQLVRLLNVSSLLSNGYKISKIAELDNTNLRAAVKKVALSDSPDEEVQINELLRSALEFNEASFNDTLDHNLLRFGVKESVIKIIYPFFKKVGLLWQINEMNPAQEHFATNLVKRKLLSIIDQLPVHTDSHPEFLLFLPENEYHEIGLTVADYLIRSAAKKTIYLGANVPFTNVVESVKTIQPEYLLTFVVTPKNDDRPTNYLNRLAKACPDQTILASGLTFNESNQHEMGERIVLLKSLEDLEAILNPQGGGQKSDN